MISYRKTHGLKTRRTICVLTAIVAISASITRGQETPAKTNEDQPRSDKAQTAPVEDSKTTQDSPTPTTPTTPTDATTPTVPSALAIEVAGKASWAIAGTSPIVADGWTPIAVGDELKPGTLIRTGLRSHVNLQFGETTTVSIRSASYASIDQFFRNATTETVRIGLGYGTVRGGSSEGEIRADVAVTAPVATLAKRGTEGWEIGVEAGTGRFRISLAEHGLVEAIKSVSGRRIASRRVLPGQYATNVNIANMWISQDIFDRNVAFYEARFVTASDARFFAANTGSYATLDPGGGSTLADLSGRFSRSFVLANRPGSGVRPLLPILPIGLAGPNSRPEGNFGTGGIFKRR